MVLELDKLKSMLASLRMKSITKKRPVCIAVQTFDNCNAKCVFCSRRNILPTNAVMSMKLFNDLCKDYSSIGGGHLGFSPLLADPLIDPLFLERLELINIKYPNITPNIFTNGIALSKFSDQQIRLILEQVDHLDISIGGFTAEGYVKMFGVNKSEVVWNELLRLYKVSKELGGAIKVNVHVRTFDIKSVSDSVRYKQLLEMGFRCNDICDTFSSWGGLVSESDLPEGAKIATTDNRNCNIPCFMPMFNMMIMQDGRVLACGCMDAKGHMEVGNILEEGITEIWLGEKFTRIRKSFLEKKLHSVCETCSYYVPFSNYFSNPGLIKYSPSKNFWSCLK